MIGAVAGIDIVCLLSISDVDLTALIRVCARAWQEFCNLHDYSNNICFAVVIYIRLWNVTGRHDEMLCKSYLSPDKMWF